MTEKEGWKPHLKAMRNEFIDMTKPSRQEMSEGVAVVDMDDMTGVSLEGEEERAVIETAHTDLPFVGNVEEAPAEDETLFVSNMSDVDMNEIVGLQKEASKNTHMAESNAHMMLSQEEIIDVDDDEDEIEALHSFDDFE
jgi:hypothetical protein